MLRNTDGQKAVRVTEIRWPIRVVPCDHEQDCGFLHHAHDGPSETIERLEYEEEK